MLFLARYTLASVIPAGPRETPPPGQKPLLPNTVDPRKLFLTFVWNANEKRYTQQMAMRTEFQKQLKSLMEKYQFDQHLDLFNHQTLEDVHRQYLKTKNGVNLAKNFLLEKMDSIYNNFIQPSRWFY